MKHSSKIKIDKLITSMFYVSGLLYIICLFLPVYSHDIHTEIGFGCLIFGFLTISDYSFIVWLANPLYFYSYVISRKKTIVSIFTTFFAFFLALSFFTLTEVLVIDSANTYRKIIAIHYGYYLWLLSIAVLFFASLMHYVSEKKSILMLKSSLLVRLFRETFPAYKWRYALAFLFMAIMAAATGLFGWIIKDIINGVFGEKSIKGNLT